jgi:hypothetical protein
MEPRLVPSQRFDLLDLIRKHCARSMRLVGRHHVVARHLLAVVEQHAFAHGDVPHAEPAVGGHDLARQFVLPLELLVHPGQAVVAGAGGQVDEEVRMSGIRRRLPCAGWPNIGRPSACRRARAQVAPASPAAVRRCPPGAVPWPWQRSSSAGRSQSSVRAPLSSQAAQEALRRVKPGFGGCACEMSSR